ncbi:MAG TPA: hypothetical protein VNJ53_12075 [Gaiellaceae bacterium]|nr:hypothetical protein [Gaiellaceae bacterium]
MKHPLKRSALVLGILAALAAPSVASGANETQVSSQVVKPALVRPALVESALARPARVESAVVRPALVRSALADSQRARIARISLLRLLGR